MKTCTRCRETKPRAYFHAMKHGRDGLAAMCKRCHVETTRERRNRDAASIKRTGKYAWRSHIKGKYGITEAEYLRLQEWSQGGCAICGERPDIEARRVKRLSVDHNHVTGKVRGLLCTNCNGGLGKFKDSVRLLRIAMAYLDYFEPEDTP